MAATLKSRDALAGTIILVVAAILFGVCLGDRAVVSEELRWAEVAREMRRSGDYLHPTINGQPYEDKPVGSYWLIVAASHFTGDISETSARLPAAVAGWHGVLLVMLLGANLFDRRTGVLAGAILATSFGYATYARRATADMETLTGVLAAITLFARNRTREPGRWIVALWLVMGATSLTKGLLGFALPIFIIGCYATWTTAPRGLRAFVLGQRWFFNRWTIAALPAGVGLFLAPYLPGLLQSGSTAGLALLYRENVQRFYAPHNHTGPVYLYFGVIPVLAAPWAAFLPAAFVALRRTTNRDADRLTVVYFAATFAFFTLASSRRSYYLLPILPAAALLIARLLTTPLESLPSLARRLRTLGVVVVLIPLVAAGTALLLPARERPAPFETLPDTPLRSAVFAGLTYAVVVLSATVRAKWQMYQPMAVASVAALVLLYVMLVALPVADGYRTRRAFVATVLERIAADPDRLALFRARDVVFDLARPSPVPDHQTADAVAEAVRSGTVHYLIVRRRYLPLLPVPYGLACEEVVQPWDGLEQSGDRMLLLDVRPGVAGTR